MLIGRENICTKKVLRYQNYNIMDKIHVIGGKQLSGKIKISGAKNAALPLMAASILSDKEIILSNIPNLEDIKTMMQLTKELGVEIFKNDNTLRLRTNHITSHHADYELVRKMRASFLTMGPLLAREGIAEVSLPGGCSIGTRPIDLHLLAFKSLGADIKIIDGYVRAKAPLGGLVGGKIIFPTISVGATENAIMAAVLAKGSTCIYNAALEPEIQDLCNCLNSMGAKIFNIGKSKIEIQGVHSFKNIKYKVMPDRIETGTYIIAAAITNGDIVIENTEPKLLGSFLKVLYNAGLIMEEKGNSIHVKPSGKINSFELTTQEFPGFPTDMQAQIMVLGALSNGNSKITENIFENRFMHVPELNRLGANIKTTDNYAIIEGNKKLIGAPVMATDLRASVSLVLAGLVAKGETTISRIYHLDRGYENLEKKLSQCGAEIYRKDGD